MLRLVLDTNTVVSGFLWESTPGKLLTAAIEERIELASSFALISELAGVLRRTKFARRLGANADLIVSGDKDLLNLKRYQNIQIVRATQALAHVKKFKQA